jgi:hypothetical protein
LKTRGKKNVNRAQVERELFFGEEERSCSILCVYDLIFPPRQA